MVCLISVSVSVLFKPIEPSLKLEQRNTFGYEVKSDPSALSGTVPYVLLTLYVGNPPDFKRISDLLSVSLALPSVKYFVSLLTISYPLIYPLPGPTLPTNFFCASADVNPLTFPKSSAE